MAAYTPGIGTAGNTEGGKYHCTIDLLFDWFGICSMTIDNFFVFICKTG